MSGYLLDTNVISELSKRSPHPSVVEFLADQEDLWLSVIVIEELETGVQLLPEGRRRAMLGRWLSRLSADFAERLLSIGHPETRWAAALRARARRDGRVLQLADALIAGTAKANDLTIATRNVKDFGGLNVDVINPWNGP